MLINNSINSKKNKTKKKNFQVTTNKDDISPKISKQDSSQKKKKIVEDDFNPLCFIINFFKKKLDIFLKPFYPIELKTSIFMKTI